MTSLEFARDLVDVGRLDDAATLIAAALAADPASAEALCSRAYHLHACEDYPAMLDAAERAVRAAPDDPWAHRLRGVALLGLRRTDAAVTAARRAVALAPEDPYGYRLLARTLVPTGRTVEAYRAALVGVRLEPEHPDSYAVLGSVYHAAGERARGRAADATALRLAPDAEWPLRSLADADLHRWRLPAAARSYQALLRANPTSRALPGAFTLTLDWLQAAWAGVAAVPALTAVALYLTGTPLPVRGPVVAALLAGWAVGYGWAHRGLGRMWWHHVRSPEHGRREPRATVVSLVLLLAGAVLFGATPGRLPTLVAAGALLLMGLVLLLPLGFLVIQITVALRDARRRRAFRAGR